MRSVLDAFICSRALAVALVVVLAPPPLAVSAARVDARRVGSSDASTTLGINMHTHASPEQLLPVVAAGISIIRTDMSWAGIELSRGRYDFTETDRYVAALAGANLRLMAIIDAGGHPLYDGGRPPASPAAVLAYSCFVGNFTAHYAAEVGAAHILLEITNEPNGMGGYQHNATNYARVVAAAAAAAHSAVPGAQVPILQDLNLSPSLIPKKEDHGVGALPT